MQTYRFFLTPFVSVEFTSSDKDEIIKAAAVHGRIIRWSSSDQDFVNVKDMHINHIYNTINKEISCLNGAEEVKQYMKNNAAMFERIRDEEDSSKNQ